MCMCVCLKRKWCMSMEYYLMYQTLALSTGSTGYFPMHGRWNADSDSVAVIASRESHFREC